MWSLDPGKDILYGNAETYRFLVDAVKEIILIIDINDRITFVNKRFYDFLGYTKEEAIGRKISDFLILDVPGMENTLERMPYDKSETRPLKFRRKDGGFLWFMVATSPVYDEDKQQIGTTWSVTDVTRLVETQNSLSNAIQRSEFYLDLISHDISNMNQVAMGYLEVSLDAFDLNKEEKEILQKCLDVMKSSARLIDNVRTLQKAEAGKLPYEPVDLFSILSRLKDQYSSLPDREVTVNFKPHPGCVVMANELIVDVFSNIIYNAIKHSDPDKPLTISIIMDSIEEKGRTYCRVGVEDNGPGIPDELKGKIFSRFEKGKTKAAGRGLGLYLVRTLVDYFHGKVWVEDRVPGDYTKGARFVVMIPETGSKCERQSIFIGMS